MEGETHLRAWAAGGARGADQGAGHGVEGVVAVLTVGSWSPSSSPDYETLFLDLGFSTTWDGAYIQQT